ncbi:O-antigen ligase domain-containing protein [Sphingobacteriales bacterium UPWRP_1]|nr:hypothetical protein BVG80_08735 [Sphingobacteriales bacterium TSM_CSM]PSJ78511.1 O-antigen ligase domain-containing protein [Sphingobacteriales bacterium UPWRP_1]
MNNIIFDTLASVKQTTVSSAQPYYRQQGGSLSAPHTLQRLIVPGILSVCGAAVIIAYAIATLGVKAGMAIVAVIFGIPLLAASLFNPFFGLCVLLVVSFFIMGVKKFIPGEPPLGILLDVFTLFLFFGIFIRQSYQREFHVLKHPVSLLVLVWITYNILQVLNPWAVSQIAWFYTVRGMAGLTLLYFVALYAFTDLRRLQIAAGILITLGFLAAIYGLYQEFSGFNSVEWNWLNADEQRFNLIFQWGRFRKFSFLSDPTTFGILSACIGVFGLSLAVTLPSGMVKRATLFVCSLVIIWAMIYSGTRAAFILVPLALLLFTYITFNPKVIAITTFFLLVGAVVVYKSPGNPTLYRVRSAFTPNKDESMQLRLNNQKVIQPFIQNHPMGGGLGSTGEWGKRFAPDSELANFPPDSGLIRIAVEQGWLGLLIFSIFTFAVLITGVRTFLRSRQRTIKAYALAFLLVVFMLTIANYPQEAVLLLPNSIIFYVSVAALVRLQQLDRQTAI